MSLSFSTPIGTLGSDFKIWRIKSMQFRAMLFDHCIAMALGLITHTFLVHLHFSRDWTILVQYMILSALGYFSKVQGHRLYALHFIHSMYSIADGSIDHV